MKINCIKCHRELEHWDVYPPEEQQMHPIGGTVFRTYGNYGSSVFDPMDATYLDISICDECLRNVMRYTHQGTNQEYKAELDQRRKELWKVLDEIVGDIHRCLNLSFFGFASHQGHKIP
jgi:hypothetical protein